MKISLKSDISKKTLFLMICIVALTITVITVSFAWLYQNRSRTHNLETSNFTLHADVYFLQSDTSHVSASLYKDASTGYYLVNISDPSAVNYAGKLRINIIYKGVTKSYLRVYIGDMWLVNNKSIHKMNTAYITPSSWIDNRIYDNYYYYIGDNAEERGLIYCDGINDEKTINFITGIENMASIKNGQLYLDIKAEAVQINRIEAFWGIENIP